ncbi:GNAT family N-acetyltransferase [Bacillus sp. CGMCC 1.16607]|uniref:GNAT family N-acetyltransferase n=1 Tax=Bacillus sp. CGMCC 1.16607 TaxID=3351842 RepID=UPI00363F5068
MEFVKATIEDKALLKNLYSFYLHDLSAFSYSLKPNADGSFEFDSFDLIWEKEGLTPYLFKLENEIVGFCLLLEAPFTKKVDFCINDFFIYNHFRGNGLAVEAVKMIFKEKQGSYYVSQLVSNKRAVAFWKKIYEQFQIAYEETLEIEDGEEVVYQTFHMKSSIKAV